MERNYFISVIYHLKDLSLEGCDVSPTGNDYKQTDCNIENK